MASRENRTVGVTKNDCCPASGGVAEDALQRTAQVIRIAFETKHGDGIGYCCRVGHVGAVVAQRDIGCHAAVDSVEPGLDGSEGDDDEVALRARR